MGKLCKWCGNGVDQADRSYCTDSHKRNFGRYKRSMIMWLPMVKNCKYCDQLFMSTIGEDYCKSNHREALLKRRRPGGREYARRHERRGFMNRIIRVREYLDIRTIIEVWQN